MRVVLVAVMASLASACGALVNPAMVAEFPFEQRAELVWVRISVPQTTEPLNFLLDSGSSASVINLRTAKRLGVKLGQRVNVRGVGSQTDGFWPQRIEAKAGEIELPKEFLAVDLAELSRACDCGVDGLLGADFFQNRVVQLDFEAGKIRLLPSSDTTAEASVVKLKMSRGVMLAAVDVDGGKPQWLRLDSGCASALQWVTSEPKTATSKNGVSVGLTELNIPATTTTVKLGSVVFHSVPTGLHQRPFFCGESGLLGNGLLMRFERVTFDAKARRLVLEGRRAGF